MSDEPQTCNCFNEDYDNTGIECLWCRWFALSIFASNLATAGALCRSYQLGHDACTCDVGPRGHEWHPGMGCTPESIAHRRWRTDEHRFAGDECDCTECGEGRCHYLHHLPGCTIYEEVDNAGCDWCRFDGCGKPWRGGGE